MGEEEWESEKEGEVWKEGGCERRGRWKEVGGRREEDVRGGVRVRKEGEGMKGKGGGECGRREDMEGGGERRGR